MCEKKAGADLHVAGIAQEREVHREFSENFKVVNFTPGPTHYLLELSAPTGKFKAEVSEKDWKKHVLPSWSYSASEPRFVGPLPQHGFMEYLEKREAERTELIEANKVKGARGYRFPDWVVKELNMAYSAGRKSVIGDLKPEDER